MRKSIVLRGVTLSYELQRKAVRGVNIRVRSDGGLAVSAPFFTPQAVIEGLLRASQDRILAAVERAGRKVKEQARTDVTAFWGEEIPVERRAGGRNSARLADGRLLLTLKDPSDEAAAAAALEAWQKRACAEEVTALCRQYYPAFQRRGVAWPNLSFRRMKSRWGSCRPQKGALSFNVRLIELPKECAAYVVVHEFAHFLQPNHSPAFYAEVARVLPDWKQGRDRIKDWEKSHIL